MRNATLAGAIAGLVTLGPALGHAGNEDNFLFGDHASLMGGAVVATAGGTAATWYNPSGLGRNARGKLELSGTAFTLRHRNIPTGLRVTLPDGDAGHSISSTQIFIVPSSLVFVRQLSQTVSLGAGVFVAEQDLSRFEGAVERDPAQHAVGVDLSGQLATTVLRYHGGASIGWQAASGLRLGVSAFAVYERIDEFRKLFADVTGPGSFTTTFLQRLVDAEASRLSFELAVGAQWELGRDWHLGAVLRSPRLTAWESAATDNSIALVSRGPTVKAITVTGVDKELLHSTGTGLTAPPRFFLGVARKTADTEIAVEIDLRPPVFNDVTGHRWVLNARAGFIQRLNEKNHLGVGLFTDQSGGARPKVFPDSRVDYYGATLGWKRKSSVRLTAKERASSLLFSTTIAVRYALGVGDATTIDFDFRDTTNTGLVVRKDQSLVGVLYHELSLYLGTALEF